MAISGAVADDVDAVANLHVLAWRAAYRGLLPDDYLAGLSVGARRRLWGDLLDTGLQLLLAWRDGLLLGFVSSGASRDGDALAHVGEIYALYVHPDVWGTGVGLRLHDAALAALSAQQLRETTLWVLDGNTRARHFYSRHGWEADGTARLEEVPGARLRELRYRRALVPVASSP